MNTRICLLSLLAVFIVSDLHAQNRRHRRRGVVLGGLAGAAVGAAIGDKGDNETAGALIGGAVGAVAGGAIGNQKDRRIEQQHIHARQTRYYQQQLADQQAQQQAMADWYSQQRATNAVSTDDVVQMVRRGLSDSIIIQHIRTHGIRQRLAVDDIISLHEQGVNGPIINAMQTAPVYSYETPVYGPDGYPIWSAEPSVLYPSRPGTPTSRGPVYTVPEPPARPHRPYIYPNR